MMRCSGRWPRHRRYSCCFARRPFSGRAISSNSSSALPQIVHSGEPNSVPIHLYCPDLEPQALAQVQQLAASPIPTGFVAVMPDAHLGKGVTIGTVFASEHYICPNAVGVDIGCGMAAIPIDGLTKDDLSDSDKSKIQQLLKQHIPTGFAQHTKTLPGTKRVLDEISNQVEPTSSFLQNMLTKENITRQLGTLGGGNHFLEVVYDDTPLQQVWCLLHSGSRHVGNRTAQHYDQLAQRWLESSNQRVKAGDLNYMPIDSKLGQDYLRDMEWCQKYAFQNRLAMKTIMLEIMYKVTRKDADPERAVNIHHNYCQCEECYYQGKVQKLWITRKGATSARPGEWGIIPGSMGTGTYITRGKGNPQSWNSSSHGAGRQMSRTKAHAQISQADFEKAMRGIVCDTDQAVKDEAPQAYKDLSQVMQHQESLTEIVYKLQPLVNVKGFETRKKSGGKGKKTKNRRHKR